MDVENGTTDTADDLSLLAEGEDTVTEKAPEKAPEKKVERPVEEPEPEEQEEEVSEEEETPEEEPEPEETKDLAPHERPSVAALKEKFPTIFKEFPALRDMYFREKEFSALFPTVADAKEASDNNVAFSGLRDSVLSGDSAALFTAMSETDPKSLEKFASKVLPSLYSRNPDLHFKAVTPLLENVARQMYNNGKKSGNANMMNSALYLSEFIFGEDGVAKGEKTFTPKEEAKPDTSVADERAAFLVEKFTAFNNEVTTDGTKGLSDLILEKGAAGKLKIDPEGVFSKFIRDSISDKIIAEVNEQMSADKAHMAYMNSLWSKAAKDGYKGDWKARIISAYLARAKSLVPTIRTRLVSEASGTTSDASKGKLKIMEKTASRRETGSGGRDANRNGSKTYDPKTIDWDKTSDADLLDDKPSFKK